MNENFFKKFVTFSLTFILVFISVTSFSKIDVNASLQDDLAAVQKKLIEIRNQKSSLQKQIASDKSATDQYTAEIVKLKSQIDLLDNQIQEKDLVIQELNLQINILTQTIEATTLEIANAESSISRLELETDKRMVDIYIQEKTFSQLDVFFNQSGGDIIKYSVYQNSFQQETNEIMYELTNLKADLEAKKVNLEKNKLQVVADQTQLDAEKIALTESQSQLDQQRSSFYKKRTEIQARANANATKINLYSDEEAKVLAQQNIIEQQIFNSVSNLGNGVYVQKGQIIGQQGYSGYVVPKGPSGAHLHFALKVNNVSKNPCTLMPTGKFANCAGNGTLQWPLTGNFYYTSAYGTRTLNGRTSFHDAIDIANTTTHAYIYSAHSGWMYRGGDYANGFWRKVCEAKDCKTGVYTYYHHLKD